MARSARSLLRIGLAALLLSGCGDAVSPSPAGTRLRIFLAGEPFDEQTIGLGDGIQLTARVLDSDGDWIPDQIVTWSTTNSQVATVTSGGAVVATGYGTTTIRARHASGSDTARVNVAPPVTDPLACETGDEVSIEPGQWRTFTAEGATSICLPGRDDGPIGGFAEYVIVVANTGTSGGSLLPVQLRAAGTIDTGGPPFPDLVPEDRAPAISGSADGREDVRFHTRVRAESSRVLEPLLRAATHVPERVLATSPPSRDVGSSFSFLETGHLLSLNGTVSGAPCDAGEARGARVVWEGERALIVADTLNPAGGFTDTEYEAFGRFFDEEAWPLVTGAFGSPSDIDRNDRVIIFFTVAVNDLPSNSRQAASDGTVVGGFFYNRDLFSRSVCPGSNIAEVFYLMVPDPAGSSGSQGRRPFSAEFVRRRIPGLLVHEFQHLINDSRRLYVNKAPNWEETWLNEGLSHIAEELMFYRASGLGPARNLGPMELLAAPALEAFRSFHIDNFDRLTAYLADTESESLFGDDGLGTRGAAWSFLRYAADRVPGDDANVWWRLVRDTRRSGLENLAAALGADPLGWLPDWGVALWADDTGGDPGLDADPYHQLPSWNDREVFPALSSLVPGRPGLAYPLETPRLLGQPRTLDLRGGGVGFARATVPTRSRAALRATVGGAASLPPPSRVKVIVGRIR